jgi:hypothetical protein
LSEWQLRLRVFRLRASLKTRKPLFSATHEMEMKTSQFSWSLLFSTVR